LIHAILNAAMQLQRYNFFFDGVKEKDDALE